MTRQVSRAVFWGGFVLYIVSLGLPTFRGQGVFTSESPSVAEWALGAFLSPLIYLHQSSGEHFLEDLNIAKMSFFLNGWINPLFLLTMVFIVLSKTPKLVKVLRYLTLFMVPICWLALAYQHVYPHEGYILWTLGIVLVLFSKGLDNWPYVVPGPRGETPTPKTQ